MPGLVWIEPTPPPAGKAPLHSDPLLAALLRGRVAGAEVAADFLDDRPRSAPDPLLLPGLAAAAERVAQAIDAGERIAVFGDYDVDGVSATALLVLVLCAATGDPARVVARLPTRADGYGLNPGAVDILADQGATLLIAVDCASSDHANVARARARGLDVVVLDHHQMAGPAPAGAVVASAQLDPAGPYHELAAVGVAYLLAVTLADWGYRVSANGADAAPLLDLVALGTVADVAPLTGANRPLVRDGLRAIRANARPGLRALGQRAGVAPETVTGEQIAYKLGPRLNAAGRMADPQLALDLLLAPDLLTADPLAAELERLNARRRAESARVVAEAEETLRRQPDLLDRRLLVVARPDWGGGVLGLAAGRLAERFGRPAIVLSDDGDTSHGSARSVPGFDITRALDGCADLLHAHGGHGQAAGLTLPTAHLGRLAAALDAAMAAADLPPPGPPALRIEADLPAARLSLRTAELLDAMQPFGAGNPVPLLRLRGLPLRAYATLGQDGSHLRLHLQTPTGVVQAIFFGAAARSRELVARPDLDLVAAIGVDTWNGHRRLQIDVKDFRPAT